METATLQKIKRVAGKLFEAKLLEAGRVLDVRFWQEKAIVEIDLHLPKSNMSKWTEVPYIKFKVDTLTYRDYTPCGWDAETRTCTIFIDAAHNGAGSKWARALKTGDEVGYMPAAPTRHRPDVSKTIIALGDASSLGHMLALQQLAQPRANFTGAIAVSNAECCMQFKDYLHSSLDPVLRKDEYGHHSLMEWLLSQQHKLNDVVFYIAGNNTMVSQMRKLLKQQGYASGQIKVHGFWG